MAGLMLIFAQLLAQSSDSVRVAQIPFHSSGEVYWEVTDSTLLYSPHGSTAEILSFSPGLIYLSPGTYGQPGILLSGAGNLQEPSIYRDGFFSYSYLIPFFDTPRFNWPHFKKISLEDNFSSASGNQFAMNFQPIFVKKKRPFSRVTYVTKDFARDEVFALFAKTIRPGFWLQGSGALGTYGGYTQNSGYHFQRKGLRIEKIFPSGKKLNVNASAYTGEAGFPGPENAFGGANYPQLKRKVGESLLQGKLLFPVTGRFNHAYLWQIRYLSEEWTNRSPFSHSWNDEWYGQFQWQGAFDWKSHRILAAPSFNLYRLSYGRENRSVFQVNAFLGDRFLISNNWQGSVDFKIAAGNFGLFRKQIDLRIKKNSKAFPEIFMLFNHQTGGLVAPVFRDSAGYNRNWLNFLPLIGQFPQEVREKPLTNIRGGMVVPLVAKRTIKISALASGVQWFQMPVVAKSTRRVSAGNASFWGSAAFWKYWTLAGGTNLRLTNGRRAEILSAVPPIDSWGSLSFHNLFFQNDLDATVKLFFQFLGRTEFNVQSTSPWSVFRVRQPVFLLHLYGYFNVGDVRFWLSFENILDNSYFLLPGYRAPGRSFRYGLVWDFWN